MKKSSIPEKNDSSGDRGSIFLLFGTADIIDIIAITFGSLAAFVSGMMVPYFNYEFANLINAANSDNFNHKIPKLCEILLALSVIAIVAGTIQVRKFPRLDIHSSLALGNNIDYLYSSQPQIVGWTISGERQSQRIRERVIPYTQYITILIHHFLKYVNGILSQDIGWFDTEGSGELFTQVSELCGAVKLANDVNSGVSFLILHIVRLLGPRWDWNSPRRSH